MRDRNTEKFFSHENNSYPPLLSKNADLRSGKKSDLLTREEVVPATCETSAVDWPDVKNTFVSDPPVE